MKKSPSFRIGGHPKSVGATRDRLRQRLNRRHCRSGQSSRSNCGESAGAWLRERMPRRNTLPPGSCRRPNSPEIVVFLDGDYSDYPDELPKVAGPILNDEKDLVIGSRMLGDMAPGAMTVPQRFGNWLAPLLIRWFYGYRFSDPRTVPGDPLGQVAGARHARPQFWLDGGNAGKGRQTQTQLHRSPGALPQKSGRPQQGFRNHSRNRAGRLENHRDDIERVDLKGIVEVVEMMIQQTPNQETPKNEKQRLPKSTIPTITQKKLKSILYVRSSFF